MTDISRQLRAAIQRYQDHLPNDNLFIFDISGLDRIGIPIQIAALSADGFTKDGFGYGGSAEEALVGALGELTETYHSQRALTRAPACEGLSFRDMVDAYGSEYVIDPRTLGLSAGYPYTDDLPLRWVQVRRWRDNAPCWVPRETVSNDGGSYATGSDHVERSHATRSAQLFPAITCGLGAGLSMEQAISHGVLELLQRDGNCTRFRALDQGIDIELDEIESEEIKSTLAHLSDLGLRPRPKLASTEFGMANIYVIAEPTDPDFAGESFPLLATACGEAVHPNRERALRKALQEYIASRCRKCFMHGDLDRILSIAPGGYANGVLRTQSWLSEEPKALREMSDWLEKSDHELRELLKHTVFSAQQTRPFSGLPSVADSAVAEADSRLDAVHSRLQASGIEIYYLDATPPGEDSPRVVKTLAPGLEGETLSYWRIGARGAARLLSEGSPLVTQQRPGPQSLPVHLTARQTDQLGGPVYFQVPAWEKIVDGHYPLYREPSSHTVQKYRLGACH
jgi:ribosomal protein S12 methylthiotransferase accessory factor